MAAAFDPETGEALFDPETGEVIREGDVAAIAKVTKKRLPSVAPIGTASKQPDFFRSKGNGPARVSEVRSSNARRMLATSQAPKGREGLFSDESRANEAHASDFARWQSLGSPGDFDSWVVRKYAGETGRKDPSFVTRAVRTVNDALSGTNQPDQSFTDHLLRPQLFGGTKLVGDALGAFNQVFLDGKKKADREVERYMMLRSMDPKPLGAMGTLKAVGEMTKTKEGLKTLARGALDPDNMLMNVVSAVPVAGILGKGAGAVAKGAAIAAENAPRLARAANIASKTAGAVEKLSTIPVLSNVAADAAMGGALNVAQNDQNTWDDFQAGAFPGAVMGLGSSALGKIGENVVGRFRGGKDLAPAPLHPILDQIEGLREDKGTKGNPIPKEQLTAEDLHPIVSTILHKPYEKTSNKRAIADQLIQDYGHLFVPEIEKFTTPERKAQYVANAVNEMTKAKGAPNATATATPKGRKVFTEADRDQTLANYPPQSIGPDALPDYLQVGKGDLMKRHYDLKRMRDQGMKMPDGSEIPIHPGLDDVNILTQKVEAARAKKQADIDSQIAATEDAATKQKLKDQKAQNEADAAAQKAELDREKRITGTSVMLRAVAGGEETNPGSLVKHISEMKPDELGLILDDQIAGGGRFDDIMPVLEDKLGKVDFERLKDARISSQGDEKLWAKVSKIIQDQSKAKLEASNAGAQKVLDSANESQAIREGVASTDEAAATADANAEMARKRAEEKSATDEEQFLKASDDEAEAAFQDVISKYPERAELLGISKSDVAAANNPDSHFNKGAKARIQAQIKDAVRVARERGLPKGFF